jgi:hypothetical protein
LTPAIIRDWQLLHYHSYVRAQQQKQKEKKMKTAVSLNSPVVDDNCSTAAAVLNPRFCPLPAVINFKSFDSDFLAACE